MDEIQEADQEVAGLALTPLDNGAQSHAPLSQRNLLPGPFASAISLVAATSSLSLRIGGLISNVAIHGAKITTLTGFELGRAVLEGVLARAGQDVVETSTGKIGRAAAEGLLQRALSSLHHAITNTSFLVSAGFQISSTSINTSLAIGQYFLSALDAVFGDNETSKAIATIIVLVQREINSPDIIGKGERLSTADIITGVAGFALLQQWNKQQTKQDLERSGTLDVVWDIVVLADGDSQVTALTANATTDDETAVGSSGTDQPNVEHRPRSSASFMSALGGDTNFEGFTNDDSRSFMSVASSRRQFDSAPERFPEQTFREHLASQLKPGATVKVTNHSMTINSVTVEIEGDDTAMLEPPGGYSLVSADESDAGHRKFVYQTRNKRQKSRHFEVPEIAPFRTLDSSQNLSTVSNLPLSGSHGDAAPTRDSDFEDLSMSSTPPQGEGYIITNEDEQYEPAPNVANQKRQRSHPLSSAMGHLSTMDLNEKPLARAPEGKKHSLKQSLKTTASYRNLVDLFNNGHPRKRGADTPGPSSIQHHSTLTRGQHKHISGPTTSKTPLVRGQPASSQMQRPISPMAAMRRLPPSASHRQTSSSLGVPTRTSSISSSYQIHPRTNPHKRPTSSIYSIAASETSLILHAGDQDSNESISRSLNRDGFLPGQYPQMTFANNASRFCRFSLASYGSSFLRFLGAASPTTPHITDFTSGDHYEHQAFTSYARLPSSTVLLSSFVDPKGVPVSAGAASLGTVLVHFVSLDHEAKSVVLSCRGTLGFEDILTDLTANYEDLDWEGQTYQVHQGMLAAARKLLTSHGGRVLATIRAALEEFADYGLVLCGHSLGGGVASVLAIMLAQRNGNKLFGSSAFVTSLQPQRRIQNTGAISGNMPAPEFTLPPGRPIHVYAYGPAASVSPSLQEATKGLVTSIIHGRDSVPFLSLGTLRDFQHVALAFKTDTRDAKGEVRRRVWDGFRKALKEKAGLGRSSTLFGDAWLLRDHDPSDDEWSWLCLQSLRAGLQAQKLVPAGEVFHIQTNPVLQRHAFVQSNGQLEEAERSFKPATHLTVTHIADVEHFCKEVTFSTSMFHDHVPLRYEKALDDLEKGLGG